MIKLSDYIAKRLVEHGVEHFFLVSGGGAMHLNDSLGRKIPYTACHHEQACSFAAEGYARINQKLAVVNVTTGPGGLNCLNGLFGQWTDSVPVLYISGQVKYTTTTASCPDIPLRQLGDQQADIISTVKHFTKYAKMVIEPEEIKYHLDRAIYEAQNGRKGPVWLDIPMNVQAALIDEKNLKEFETPVANCVSNNVKKFAEDIIKKLETSERPLIIAGHGIRLSGQISNFHKLTEKLKIPVVSTLNGFDIMETENSYYTGRIGTIGQRAGNFALQNADCILCLGTRNNIRQVSYNFENFADKAYKIVVDIDEAELQKPLVKPDMPVCADLADIISQMLNQVQSFKINENNKKWLNFCQNLKEKYSFKNRQEQVQKGTVIEPYHFTYVLTKCMKENDIAILANGSACVCTFQNAIIKKGQRFISNSGSASMGWGIGSSIGAWYQSEGRNIICLEGDGSIMMNIQELQTIVFNKIPLKLFVINNGGYSSIRQTQKNFFDGHMTGSGINSGVSVPDFVKIGEAFGLKTRRLTNPKTMKEEITDILNTDSAVLAEVITEQDYAFLPKLLSKKQPDGSIVSARFENMFPYINDKETPEIY